MGNSSNKQEAKKRGSGGRLGGIGKRATVSRNSPTTLRGMVSYNLLLHFIIIF
jgi:hypothetical protein